MYNNHNCVEIISEKMFKPRQAIAYHDNGSIVTVPLKEDEVVNMDLLSERERDVLKRVDGFDLATRRYVNDVAKETLNFILNKTSSFKPFEKLKHLVKNSDVDSRSHSHSDDDKYYQSVFYSNIGLHDQQYNQTIFFPNGIVIPKGAIIDSLYEIFMNPCGQKHTLYLVNRLVPVDNDASRHVILDAQQNETSSTLSRYIPINIHAKEIMLCSIVCEPALYNVEGDLLDMSMQFFVKFVK